jgi:hypothetical protein
MHVIQTYLEGEVVQPTAPFGTPEGVWEQSRALARQGHWVSIVAPASGRLDGLRELGLERLDVDFDHDYTLPVHLDASADGRRFAGELEIPLSTSVHWLSAIGIDLYFLSNDLLDRAAGVDDQDLRLHRSLAYQVDTIHFIRSYFEHEHAEIRVHDLLDPNLLPAGLATDHTKHVVSALPHSQSDASVTRPEHRPIVAQLLGLLEDADRAAAG